MGRNFNKKCMTCGKPEVEQIEDWVSFQCVECNTKDIEDAEERREFHYYHPKG